MIKISRDDLKNNNLPTVSSPKISDEQARVVAEIIYNILMSELVEETVDKIA